MQYSLLSSLVLPQSPHTQASGSSHLNMQPFRLPSTPTLMKDEKKREEMKKACAAIANKDAAIRIAERLIKKANSV